MPTGGGLSFRFFETERGQIARSGKPVESGRAAVARRRDGRGGGTRSVGLDPEGRRLLNLVPSILRQFGVDPAAVPCDAGLASDALAHPDTRIPFVVPVRVMSDSACRTNGPHFGVLAAREWHLSHMDMRGGAIRNGVPARRDVAMFLGTIGGAFFGNEARRRHDQPQQAHQSIVRTKSGVLVAITQPPDPRLAVGQRVYIEGNGEGARVVPRQWQTLRVEGSGPRAARRRRRPTMADELPGSAFRAAPRRPPCR